MWEGRRDGIAQDVNWKRRNTPGKVERKRTKAKTRGDGREEIGGENEETHEDRKDVNVGGKEGEEDRDTEEGGEVVDRKRNGQAVRSFSRTWHRREGCTGRGRSGRTGGWQN
jgi:hypothetical protein